MTLGQRISLYRKKLNISQEELGARLGVSRQAVSKWETDLSAPDLNNLIGLARELGVSVAELTETPEEPVPPKNTSKKWWFLLSVCVLLPVLIAGYLLYRINQPPAGQVSDYAEPASDFYLQWQVPRTDGREWYEFLTLGNQDVPFPFHTSLHLTAPEKIVTEGTDLHLAAVHHAVCGGCMWTTSTFRPTRSRGRPPGIPSAAFPPWPPASGRPVASASVTKSPLWWTLSLWQGGSGGRNAAVRSQGGGWVFAGSP